MAKLKPNQFSLGGHLITERPILFQTEMVRANMEDRKTQTRRTNGLELLNDDPEYQKSITLMKMDYDIDGHRCLRIFRNGDVFNSTVFKSPYGKPGDLLWVRENYLKIPYVCGGEKGFKISFPDRCSPGVLERLPLKPSIHLPKSASRIWAMVEEVRVERLQEISEQDAIAEGVLKVHWPKSAAVVEFINIWDTINGFLAWEENPWVWVIKYRILSKTGRPADKTILHHYLNVVKGEKNYMTI